MKMTEPKNVFIVILLVFSSIITIYSFSLTAVSPRKAGGVVKETLPVSESLSGSTEFYFLPAGDNRIWHVVNNYKTLEGQDCNYSVYTFSRDSVEVINEFAGMPDAANWDISLAGVTQKQ